MLFSVAESADTLIPSHAMFYILSYEDFSYNATFKKFKASNCFGTITVNDHRFISIPNADRAVVLF